MEPRTQAAETAHDMSDTLNIHSTILDTLPSSDELLSRRVAIVRELSPLRALYGGNGYRGERAFKQEEAKIAIVVRARLRDAGEKTTEPQIDALVRTDDKYTVALTKDVNDAARWVELEERLEEVEWRLRMRQTDASLLAAEARLQ